MNDIKYSKVLTAKGRNGLIKQSGLAITPNAEKDTLSLSPLTSKGGFTDSCWLEIPKESLPELLPIFSTDDLLKELKKRNSDPEKFTEKQGMIADDLETLWDSCQEAIDGEWDYAANPEGFETMQQTVSHLKCLLGLQR